MFAIWQWWSFIILFVGFLRLTQGYVSPVYVFKAKPQAMSGDGIISQHDFAAAIKSVADKKMLIVFLELMLRQDHVECDYCLSNMKTVLPTQYYEQVQDPYEALALSGAAKTFAFANDSGIINFECMPSSFLTVQFNYKDSETLLKEKLIKHDLVMHAASGQKCNAVYLYMGVDKRPKLPIKLEKTSRATLQAKDASASIAIPSTISPVYIWNKQVAQSSPALVSIKQDMFASMMAPLAKSAMLVAFVEDGLDLKDFKCKAAEKQSCYRKLKAAKESSFFLRVENPLSALRGITSGNNLISLDKNGEPNRTVECKMGSLTTISFADTESNRSKKLELHDTLMSNVATPLSNCEVAYFYMAPEIAETSVSAGQLLQHPLFVLFYSKLTVQSDTTETELSLTEIKVKKENNKLDITFNTNTQEPFSIAVVIENNYFTVKSFKYDGNVFRATNVATPSQFSYFCGDLAVTSKKATLIWKKIQFQGITKPFKGTFKFAEAWHCVGFFSTGIISGLFVMSFIISIALSGVVWIMDINAMSRFDDADGKTITVNATD